MDQRGASNRPSEPRRIGGPSLSPIGRLTPGRSPRCRPASFLTGGGHVYPFSSHRLAIFHGHLSRERNAKTTGFPGNTKKEADQGGERGYIYTKIVNGLSNMPFLRENGTFSRTDSPHGWGHLAWKERTGGRMNAPTNNSLAAALGRIPSGLFILTVRHGSKETAMLASWVQQCSFDPPRLTVAIQKGRELLRWLTDDAAFVLNVLPEGGEEPDRPLRQGIRTRRGGLQRHQAGEGARDCAGARGRARLPGLPGGEPHRCRRPRSC